MNNFKRHSFICICLCLLVSDYCFSQVKTTADITDITKVAFLLPGISYEKRIGKFQSLYGQAFIHTSFSFSYSSSLGTTSSISFEPALTLQYRYYYNFNKRTEKGKQTAMNSLNYVSPTILTILAELQKLFINSDKLLHLHLMK